MSEPDEVQTAEKTHIELIRLGGMTVMRAVLQPGWHWAEHVKPRVGTEKCEVAHLDYVISGRLRVRLENGEEMLLEPGDFAYLAPGHDAWVEGDEAFVAFDIAGGETFVKGLREERKAA